MLSKLLPLFIVVVLFDHGLSQNTTESPSFSPTDTPTLSPSFSPIQHPTNGPSSSPTAYPSRSPTMNILWQETIYLSYNLTNITRNISIQITDLREQKSLEHLFEGAYVKIANTTIDTKKASLTQRNFNIKIDNVVRVHNHCKNYTNHSVVIRTTIQCLDNTVRANIVYLSTSYAQFRNYTQMSLRKHFKYDGLLLFINKPYEKNDDLTEPFDAFYIWIIGISVFCSSVATAAFVYNVFIPNHRTDNANWIAVIIYNLQVIDLLTDIRLTVEMFLALSIPGSENHPKRVTLFIAAYGTLLTTVIPFIINLALAINIKRHEAIKKNPFARSYFQHMLWLFVLLVTFSGGVNPTLAALSSRLFGFDVFNCGLTAMELKNFSKIKFYVTNLLENFPQLIFSILYINYLGQPTTVSIFSLMMSILQLVTAFSLYAAMRRPTDCHAIQYDLEMRVGHKSWADMSFTSHSDDFKDDDNDYYISTESENNCAKVNVTECVLTPEECTEIRLRKERKAELRRWLCGQLSLPLNRMEIGYVTLTHNGCIIHIVNYVYESEVKKYQDSMLPLEPIKEQKKSISTNREVSFAWDGDSRSFNRAAKNCLKDLYHKKSIEVNNAFASHFGFEKDNVMVVYHKRYKYSTWAILNRDQFPYQEVPTVDHDLISGAEDAGDVKLDDMGKTSSETPIVHLTQTLDDLKKYIRDLLEQRDAKDVKCSLLKEGYDEALIDSVLNIGKLMANKTNTTEYENDTTASDVEKGENVVDSIGKTK